MEPLEGGIVQCFAPSQRDTGVCVVAGTRLSATRPRRPPATPTRLYRVTAKNLRGGVTVTGSAFILYLNEGDRTAILNGGELGWCVG